MANGLINFDPRYSAMLRSRPQGQITAQGRLPVGYNIPSNLPQLTLPNSNMLRMPMQGVDARVTPMQDVGFQASQAQPEPKGFRQRAKGILGSIGGFLQNNPDLLDTLAIGFGGMSMNPNQALMQQAAGRIQQRQELARIQGVGNRTAEYFRSIGRDDLAQAVESNPELASDIYQEYFKSQFEEPQRTFRTLSAEEVAARGLPPGQYQISSDEQRVYPISDSGPSVNVYPASPTPQQWGLEQFREDYPAFREVSNASRDAARNMEVLTDLMQATDTNALQRLVADRFPTLSALVSNISPNQGVLEVVNQIRSQLIPQQRPAGSGTTSDRDMALYERAVGSLLASPETRQLSLQVYQRKADIDAQRTDIAYRVANEQISIEEGQQLLRELDEQSVFTPEQREMLSLYVKPVSFPGNDQQWQQMTNEQRREYLRLGEQ